MIHQEINASHSSAVSTDSAGGQNESARDDDDGKGPIQRHDSHGHLMHEYGMHPQEDNFDSYERYAPRHDLTEASNKRAGAGLPSGDRSRLDMSSARSRSITSSMEPQEGNIPSDNYYNNADGNNASNSDQIGSTDANNLKYANSNSKPELVEQKQDDRQYKMCQNQHFSIFDNEYPDPMFEVPENSQRSNASSTAITAAQAAQNEGPGAGARVKTHNNIFGQSHDSMFMCMNPDSSSR